MLSTAFALIALLAAAACALFAYHARRDSLEAAEALRSFKSARATLGALSDRCSALEGRLDRLAGRVYAQARRPQVNEQVAADIADDVRADADPELQSLLSLQSAPAASPGRPNGK